MLNYYTLIYLKDELKRNILSARFSFAISPHKNVLHCYFEQNDAAFRLIFSAAPGEIVLFKDDYSPPKKQNVLSFFPSLEGHAISDIILAKYDRLLSIIFDNDNRLIFRLFGNHANVFLVDGSTIVSTFKNAEQYKGAEPPKPEAPNFDKAVTAEAKPKNQILRINPLLPRNLLPAIINKYHVERMSVEEVKSFTHKITHALRNDPHPRVLKNGAISLWPSQWLDIPTEKSFNSVNACIRYAYYEAVQLRRLHQKKERISLFLDQTVKKKRAEFAQLQQADKSLARADDYEKKANLLMAHAHQSLQPGTSSLDVKDIYKNGQPISISLKEGLTIAENAQRFYRKAKASRRSYQKAKQRAPQVKSNKQQAEQLGAELADINRLSDLSSWIKEHKKTLKKYGYGGSGDGQAVSPFRKFKVGKYEIWLGKNAKSNDELTSHAHKEDIWLHARGVAGSHAVIRMGNEKSYPPKSVILRAASYAAWYSKAKNSKSAPVMYTKCKYVYKPSGSNPGAAVAKREEVVMVPPTKPK